MMMRTKQSISFCQRLLKFRSFGSLGMFPYNNAVIMHVSSVAAISKVPDDMLPHLLDHWCGSG